MAAVAAQLARSSRSPRRCWSLVVMRRWPGTGWPGSRTAGPTSSWYAMVATLLIPAAVTFVPSFVLVSTPRLGQQPARPDRPGAVPGVRDVPVPAVLPRVPEGAGGGRPDRRAGLLADVLAGRGPELARASSPPSATITFIGSWNAFLWPLVIGQDQSSWTVQIALSTFLTQQTSQPAPAVHRRRDLDPAAAGDVPLPPTLDRAGRGAQRDQRVGARLPKLVASGGEAWDRWGADSRAGRRRREADDRRGHGIRPPGRPPKGGRPSLRRAPGRHGLPRHHLHRPAGGPPRGDRGVGRGHGLVPGRDRQPGRGVQPARPADRPRRGVRRRRLRRLLLAHPRGAGARRPQPLAAVRRLALAGDRVDVGRSRPQHGDPRSRRAGRDGGADGPAAADPLGPRRPR